MKNLAKLMLAGALAAIASIGRADAAPILPGWTCYGNCGTLGADGDVPLSPFGSPAYSWVSSNLGVEGEGQLPDIGGNNGSRLLSPLFSAGAGDILSFYFNFVTSDGAEFADYGWAALTDTSTMMDSILFTARTTPTGNTVPGTDLPGLAPGVTLAPPSTAIIPGAPDWSPLGDSSGQCFATGCGYTGWIQMSYTVPTAGSYYLTIGVTNWSDEIFDTGMAMDGAAINGQSIGGVPAPAAITLFGFGFIGMGVLRRRTAA